MAAAAVLLSGASDAPRIEPPAMVVIEAGWFTMGSRASDLGHAVELCAREVKPAGACRPEVFGDETPAHRVYLSRYGIDRREVTHRAYGRCVTAGRCLPPHVSPRDERVSRDRHPVVGVTWDDARRYCEFVGGRLPTEAEWERAARGPSQRRYPWGRFYNDRLSNHGRYGGELDAIDGYRYAAPVGAFPDGANPYGMLDMAGNVWELTADRYAPDAYENSNRVDPAGPTSGTEHVMRGGSWRSASFTLRVTYRGKLEAEASRPDVGFRCAYDLRPSQPRGGG